MSRIAKSVSSMVRMTASHRLVVKATPTTGKSLNQMRGIASVVSKKFDSDHRQTTIISKRFAANSPQVTQELVQFLAQEIELEKKTQKKSLPSVSGWTVTNDGSNVVLVKNFGSEQITVRTNVNHSVDQKNLGGEGEANDESAAEMVCRPDFAVEIKKGNTTLGINCSFVDSDDIDDETESNPNMSAEDRQALEDDFEITEFSLYEGEFGDNSYAVSGEVMDGSMYDLMMDLLYERGIDQQFVRSLVDYTTVYEHSQYVGLLAKLKDFLSK